MNESIPQSNVVDAALAAGRALAATPIAAKDDPHNAVIVPVNYKVVALDEYIEKYLPAPRRLKANAQLANADSFIRYVNDFKSEHTRIFAVTCRQQWRAVVPGGAGLSFAGRCLLVRASRHLRLPLH
jgi:hypothetical protein